MNMEEVKEVTAAVIWIIVGIVLVIAEVLTFTFYMLWLGIGALAAGLTAWFLPEQFLLQFAVGAAVALALTFYTRSFARKIKQTEGFHDKIEELIGSKGVVLEPITVEGLGIVRVGNETWSAKADEEIAKDETIVVTSRSTSILTVEKWRSES
jgi:membrane protein implicated in regulation of membrane protease activity